MKVSIVIPTFNRSGYLRDAIDSCLAQTVACEIIVCDHGSTDDTPAVVQSYGNKITYLRRDKDHGVHFCWLDGVINASHDLIHINYDDDWIEPTFIERTLALMSDDVGFVFTEAKLYYDDKKEYGPSHLKDVFPLGKVKSSKVTHFQDFYTDIISPGCTLLRKKDILDGLYQGQIPFSRSEYKGVGPDLLFTLLSASRYPYVGYIPEPLAIFRAHASSITTDAIHSGEKYKKIVAAYDETRKFNYILTVFKKYKLDRIFFLVFNLKRKIYRRFFR